MAVNKAKVLETLNDHFLLEDDYVIKHEKDFENPKTGFKELIRVYLTYPLGKNCNGKKLELDTATNSLYADLDSVGNQAVSVLNTLEFIKGKPTGCGFHGHQWHLRSYYKETPELLEPVFTKLLADIENFQDFEAFYIAVEKEKNDLEKVLKKTKLHPDYLAKIGRKRKTLGYGRTCIYDFSLRAAYRYKQNEGTARLLPSRFVYVHTKPAHTFRILKELGVFKNIPNKARIDHLIEYQTIKEDFLPYSLDAIDMENFFCVMHDMVVWFDEKFYPTKK